MPIDEIEVIKQKLVDQIKPIGMEHTSSLFSNYSIANCGKIINENR